MTPQENIRWYWDDLSSSEKVSLLAELYNGMTSKEKDKFNKLINNN
jgi:hypothetical protein